MYPIKFENLYFEKLWGGRDFETFRDNLIEGNIGESWDVSCHKNGMSIISNGEYKGKRFDDIIKTYGSDLLGSKCLNNDFPMLVKLINSKEKLSVQVHPGDEYAAKYENQQGKTEAWYVIDAKPGAQLIVGTKDCDKDTFRYAIESGDAEKYLNKIDIKKGDCFLINSGLVHAICEGAMIAEIQQNSDVTYRIYDYGRPRELHIDKSLDVINFDLQPINGNNNSLLNLDGYSVGTLCECDYFTIEKYVVKDKMKDTSNNEKFYILTCVDGSGEIISNNGLNENFKIGDSVLIPATMGEYEIMGNLTFLKSYI